MPKWRIDDTYFSDPTPCTWPCWGGLRSKVENTNLIDAWNCCVEKPQKIPFSEKERELTHALRMNHRRYGRTFAMQKLTQRPMRCITNLPALILPRDHDPSLPDILSYTNPLYHSFICDFVDGCMKIAPEQDHEIMTYLLVDYSAFAPYNSVLRHDGRMAIKNKWDERDMAIFQKEIGRCLEYNLANTDPSTISPPMNPTKSVGFDTTWPDGTSIDSWDERLLFYPRSLQTRTKDGKLIRNEWMRVNRMPIRLEYCKSGALYESAAYLLENCDRYDDPNFFEKSFANKKGIIVACEAYRLNSPDAPKEFTEKIANDGAAKYLGKFYKKNRDMAFEEEEYVYTTGTLNDQLFSTRYRSKHPAHQLTFLRKRSMFPANNASIGAFFTYFFNKLLHRWEDGASGFPTNTPKVIARMERFLNENSAKGIFYVKFDRRTAEQFMTDNFDKMVKITPRKIARVVLGMGHCVLPSAFGPRVLAGALVSGAPNTTFMNVIAGTFENCLCTCEMLGARGKEREIVIKTVIDNIHNAKDAINWEELGFKTKLKTLHFLGTDDQMILCVGKECKNVVSERLRNYADGRFLTVEVVDECTTFGQRFTGTSFEPNRSLAVRQAWFIEHTKLGCQAAMKYASRLESMDPAYVEVAERLFRRYKFGNVNDYKSGAAEYLQTLTRFGYPIDAEYNRYSFKDELIIGSYLRKHGIDPINGQGKYPLEYVLKMDDLLSQYLRGGLN